MSSSPIHIATTGTVSDQLHRLPFRIRPANDDATRTAAAKVRFDAYNRHLPQFSAQLTMPEDADTAPGCALFVAESKLDGSILGSIRVQTNLYAPLPVEKSIVLPAELTQGTLGEAVRLSVTRERPGSMVRALLCKAYLKFCAAEGIDNMVVTGRQPLDMHYQGMNFVDVYPGRGFINMKHIGDLPHRVMFQDVAGAEHRLFLNQHPFHAVFTTEHPDFDISAPGNFRS